MRKIIVVSFAIGVLICSAMRDRGFIGTITLNAQGRGAATAPEVPRGLRLKTDRATPGFVLFSPLTNDTAYLIDMSGRVVHSWKTGYRPAGTIYLLNNGHILRGANDTGSSGFGGGGAGGRFQEFDWDGKLVWDFVYNTDRLPHHDFSVLPNGHILAVAWEKKSPEEARRAGRRDSFIPQAGVWPDMLIEFEPQPPSGARIVWEWHSWDHVIASAEAAAHPEKINVNGDLIETPNPTPNPPTDIFHTNAVNYNPQLDQIMVSVPRFNEIWVIDHSTTTLQAAGSNGGKSGKGGDILYRWGNPQTYGRGSVADQRFGFEHDARWIADGLPGAGHMMVFSNRGPGPAGPHTVVYEFAPAIDRNGRYILAASGPYGPVEPVWTYSAPGFDATYISGAQRLPNGNTLMTSGPQGRFFEVNPAGETLWEYWSEFRGEGGSAGANGDANPYSAFRATHIPPDHSGVRNQLRQ